MNRMMLTRQRGRSWLYHREIRWHRTRQRHLARRMISVNPVLEGFRSRRRVTESRIRKIFEPGIWRRQSVSTTICRRVLTMRKTMSKLSPQYTWSRRENDDISPAACQCQHYLRGWETERLGNCNLCMVLTLLRPVLPYGYYRCNASCARPR